MPSIKILTWLTIGLLLIGGIIVFIDKSINEDKGPVFFMGMGAVGFGAWSFIALLVALVIKSIKGESK